MTVIYLTTSIPFRINGESQHLSPQHRKPAGTVFNDEREKIIFKISAVERLNEWKGRILNYKVQNEAATRLVANIVNSIKPAEATHSIETSYEFRDYGVFILHIDTSISCAAIQGNNIAELISAYQKAVSDGLSHPEKPLDLENIIDKEHVRRMIPYVDSICNSHTIFESISDLGSYSDLAIVIDEYNSRDIFDSIHHCLRARDGGDGITATIGEGNEKNHLFSNYSIFALVSNNENGNIDHFKELVFHLNVSWNLLRNIRERIRKNFIDIVDGSYTEQDIVSFLDSIDKEINLFMALSFECDPEALCEWGSERTAFGLLWDGWRTSQLLKSTEAIIAASRSAVVNLERKISLRRSAAVEKMVGLITFLSFFGTIAQLVDYFFSDNMPGQYPRVFTMAFFATIFALSLLVFLRVGNRSSIRR